MKAAETGLCRRLWDIPLPFSLPVVSSKYVFTRVWLGGLIKWLIVTSNPYQLLCLGSALVMCDVINRC